MSGQKSRNKGARGEIELARELTRLFGVEAHRGRQYHGGPDSPDVKAEIPGISPEVKRAEVLHLYKALAQAEKDAGKEKVPIVFHRKNTKRWVAICYLDDLPQIATQLFLTLAENA